MNHFKTLVLGTALLFTATVETQAANCFSCPTGLFKFNCTSSGACEFTSTSTTNDKWSATSSTTTHFTGTATLTPVTPRYVSSEITCIYPATATHPALTLTSSTCKLDSTCGVNKFSCS